MIEKEIILQSDDNTKATIFFIKARSVKDFFSIAEELKDQLNKLTENKYKLKINYDIMFSDIRFPDVKQNVTPNSSSHSAIG